ncbi:MAG TPA: M28 family peptidase [Lachnospiraceae bacterium]|nr:M28 family peptidase [Lachnospiraceae bacterium]
MKSLEEEYINRLDIAYSYTLAKRMEENHTNPVLGYRTAGSDAEIATGELLVQEMKKIGLSKVWKDPIIVDSWDFKKAILVYDNNDGKEKKIQLGAYQTQFITGGQKSFQLVYVGKGTEKDYENLNVTGKLVLVDINQRDEWWINYPVYQAYLKGAAALIAVQTGGYGEVDDVALNAQDIAGPAEAAAFSISRKDAEDIKRVLKIRKEMTVYLDAYSSVKKNCTTYNIIGEITGKNKDRKIMLSAHYDSYFNGFQDDNTGISMMLSIAKELIDVGWQPQNTILVCAMAAEEWGVVDSQFDWSTGAYEQVFTVHPQWRGQVIADLNFELPALAHGTRARIRSTYEYADFLERFLEELPELTHGYPEDTRITAPIETWSDDFSIAIAGIPSMVNDFTGGSFLATHYHSQFDNDNYYDEDVYRLHHELFGLLLIQIDRTVVVPLDFSPVFKKAEEVLDMGICKEANADGEGFATLLSETSEIAQKVYEKVRIYNDAGIEDEKSIQLERSLLTLFQKEQDTFVRIDWYGNVVLPHVVLQESLELLIGAKESLEEGNLSAAMRKIYEIDNNRYAFMFEEKVYDHFTSYVFDQPKERLKWGYQRIIGYVNLFGVVKRLLQKNKESDTDYHREIIFLREAVERQKEVYRNLIVQLKINVEEMKQMLSECLS